jgi:hypothetical protein
MPPRTEFVQKTHVLVAPVREGSAAVRSKPSSLNLRRHLSWRHAQKDPFSWWIEVQRFTRSQFLFSSTKRFLYIDR